MNDCRRTPGRLGPLLALCWGAAAASCAARASGGPAPAAVTRAAPVEAPASGAPDDSFRAQAPAPEGSFGYSPPVPVTLTLPNGMDVILVERHSMPLVAAELVVRGGTAAFPGESAAAFSLMASLTTTGTEAFTERSLYALMNARMIELRATMGDAWLSFRVRALASSVDAALVMLSQVALHPSFPPEPFEIRRQRQLGWAPRARDDVALVARRNLYASLYGPSHPYTRFFEDDTAALAKLTRDDIVRVWRESVDPAQTALVVVGDIDGNALKMRVETLFGGGWAGAVASRVRAPVPAPAPVASRLIAVDRPGAPQATIFYGATVAPIDAPGHAAQLIARALLGGMRSSAVSTQLRNELGAMAFGGARLNAIAGAGILWWEGSVARERSADALAALELRVRALHERGPDPDELVAARSYLARSLPRDFETVGRALARFAGLAAYHLPLDRLATLPQEYAAVSAQAVRAAVPAPAAMKAVVVGDLASLRAPLLALGWGPIEERDADANLVRTIAP